MPTVAILGTSLKTIPLIADEMQRSGTLFILSDRNVVCQRYLARRGYRNVMLYCQGDTPKPNMAAYPVKLGFTSQIEVEAALEQDCDVVLGEEK